MGYGLRFWEDNCAVVTVVGSTSALPLRLYNSANYP